MALPLLLRFALPAFVAASTCVEGNCTLTQNKGDRALQVNCSLCC